MAQLSTLGHKTHAMKFDQLCVIGMGISFTGIGISMRKQQKPQWRAFLFGGIILLSLGLLAITFGWSV